MSTKLLYSIWTISIIFAIVADILISVDHLQTASLLLGMSFWSGFIIWIILLCFQKNNRGMIHQYGLIGFITTISVPMILYSKYSEQLDQNLTLPPL